MKKFKFLIIIIFFVIILTPIVFINLQTNQVSSIDNSKLPEFESIKDNITFENYLGKRIGFRSTMINFYIKLNDIFFNRLIHPLYEYGENKYVFFKMKDEILDTEFLDNYAMMIKKMQDYVTNHGSVYLYVFNPTKKKVYSEYLPKGYVYNDLRMNYLKKKFAELNINYLDNTDLLNSKKKDYDVFNKQYDAGHWNEYGAFFGIDNIYSRLNDNFNLNIENLNINNYEIKDELQTFLPVSEFEINEKVPVFTLKENNYKFDSSIKKVKIDEQRNYLYKTVNNTKSLRLLFFRGSYFNNKDKFVSPYFKEVYYIHNYQNAINFDYYYSVSNYPDIVLFEGVEYSTNDQYYNLKKMINKEYNISYNEISNLINKNIESININEFRNQLNNSLNQNIGYIDISFKNDDVKYAYLLVNDRVYDFTKDENEFLVTVSSNIVKNNHVKIVLVNKDITSKYEFNLK